jgi:hypothetical protein
MSFFLHCVGRGEFREKSEETSSYQLKGDGLII